MVSCLISVSESVGAIFKKKISSQEGARTKSENKLDFGLELKALMNVGNSARLRHVTINYANSARRDFGKKVKIKDGAEKRESNRFFLVLHTRTGF